KVTAIEESNDLTSLSLNELNNLKVYEAIIMKDFEMVKDDKNGKSERKCFRCGDPNHLIRECPKPPRSKEQIAFVGRTWCDSDEDEKEKTKDETCLVAQASNEIYLRINLEPDEWIKDSGCSKYMTGNRKLFSTYKAYNRALKDESWIIAMQEELNQFITNDVWELEPQPKNMTIIGTKWVFINKLDENGIVSRNKARLVTQGYNQQEGIDYDETYAPVARLESIRILLAYACTLDFKLFQMDVKSAFMNGFINEEVYVAQPLRFIDFKKLDHVYKLKKALYGLKQAPKILSIDYEPYQMGTIKDTLGTADDGGVTLGIDRPRTYNDLDENEKNRFVLLQGKDAFDASSREWCRVGRRRVVVSCRRINVDDEPTAQTIFMENLSSAVSSLQQVGPSNVLILSEVLNLENAIDHHAILNEVQQINVLDSDNADMSYSNVIPYEQYVKHNKESIVPSGASSVQYDDYMLHENSTYVSDDSFTITLNIYKDQVAIYEQRAKFELIDHEQKMDDQMRILIQEHNFREEKLKKELHSLQLQLNHTIHHKRIIKDSVNTLQQDFKQKEMKLLNDFSRLKTLKNKLEKKLYAQDQPIQTIHMMLKPKTMCDEHREKDIVDPNPFHLKRLKWFNLPYMMVMRFLNPITSLSLFMIQKKP
nr:retrovirus-related Pol polyprotein from transposon TNT 1-94 [Tanacetum cinerariifolium]